MTTWQPDIVHTVLDATARDLDPVDPGALVEDVRGCLERLVTDWIGDGDGPAGTT